MAKSLQFMKIFDALQAASGPVTVSTVKAIDGIVATRLSTYMWEIKKNTGFVVRANRDGRNVVSYELVGAGTAPIVKVAKVKAPKIAKVAKVKAPKVAKAKKVAGPVTMPVGDSLDGLMNAMVKTSKTPINILDELDTDVEDFEDRAFAQDYIRTT